jgi:hypothetical protein
MALPRAGVLVPSVSAWSPGFLLVFIKKKTPTYVIFFFGGSK